MGRGTSAVGGTRAELNKGNKKPDFSKKVEQCVGGFFVCLPQVAFVGGVLDVVADVVVHSMSCCAVSGIKNLESKCENETQNQVNAQLSVLNIEI